MHISSNYYFLPYNKNLNFTANPAYMDYLEQAKKNMKYKKVPIIYRRLDMFDMDKLEGMQENLKTLCNLSMKQIKFFVENLTEFVTQRGCNNACVHCYADAMPESVYKKSGQQTRITMEDFNNLCDDIAKLNSIMGFSVFNKKSSDKKEYGDYITLFHDSDSSKIVLKDGNEEYDYLDLVKKVQPLTRKEFIFDTAGWDIQDKATQKRMDNMVQKYVENPEEYKKLRFNISVNPFHTMYHHSLLRKQEGKIDISNKLLDIYTTRMANVLHTFTPIIKDFPDRITCLSRCIAEEEYTINGYNEKDLIALYQKVLDKLSDLYSQDIKNGTGSVKNKEDAEYCLKIITDDINNVDSTCTTGRMLKTFPQMEPAPFYIDPFKPSMKELNGILDVNGDFYLTNWEETFPTNIKLNYSTKGNKTPSINPRLQDAVINV